jgi:DNA-binding CsgD family transcriptional regulator
MTEKGYLLVQFQNVAPKAKALRIALLGPESGWAASAPGEIVEDLRGPIQRGTWTMRTSRTSHMERTLVAEYEAGETVWGLARKHGMHRSTVVRKLRGAGVTTGQRRLSDSYELVTEVKELREQGLSLRAIAKRAGISYPSVQRLLYGAGR